MTRICGILHIGSAHRASMRATLCVGRRSLHILHIFDRGNISDRPSHAAIQPHACWYVARVHVEDTMQLAMQVVYYTTLKPQTMAVACPWILGSRLSIMLSSLGECEFVRMLWWQLGLTQTSRTLLSRIAMCRLKACSTRRGARAGRDRHFCLCPLQQGGTTRLRARWPLRRRPHATTTRLHTHLTRKRCHRLDPDGSAATCEREGRSYHSTITYPYNYWHMHVYVRSLETLRGAPTHHGSGNQTAGGHVRGRPR
jgi:hypothetical protein